MNTAIEFYYSIYLMLFPRCYFFMLLCNMEQFTLYLNLHCAFLKTAYFESPGQNTSKTAFPNSMKLSGFDPCIMNYVLSEVVLWPKAKCFINIPVKLEKILFFGMLFWTGGSMQKVSLYGKNQFHLKYSFILLLFNYHKTPLSSITKLFKTWLADLHSQLLFPYQTVAMARKQKNVHPNFNILTLFGTNSFLPCGLGCENKKSGGYPLKGTVMQIEKTVIYDAYLFQKHTENFAIQLFIILQ